ncbi:MAG: hypothetical protein R3B47_09345 [Bacteroidia bacterium]
MISFLRYVLVLLSVLPFMLQAQVLELSFDIRQGPGLTDDTLRIFLQSRSHSPVGIRAVNISLVFDGGKQNFSGYQSAFRPKWTPTFERDLVDSVNLTYWGRTYHNRWNYAIGDAIISASSLLLVPEDTVPPLKVLELYFKHLSPGMVYVESQSENPVNQIGNENFRQISYTVVPLPGTFPVRWSFFNVTGQASGEALVQWGTTAEVNNAWFEVERSAGRDFLQYEKLGQLAGQGTSSRATGYQFFDSSLGSGRFYYRIKQVDFDGGFSFSNIVSTELQAGVFSLQAGPSPAIDHFNIQLQGITQEGFRVDILDSSGKIYKTILEAKPDGKSHQLQIGTHNMTSGLYIIQALLRDGSSDARTAKVFVYR